MLACAWALLALGGTAFADSATAPADYSRLVEFIALTDQIEPLVVFNDFEQKFDKKWHKHFLAYFDDNPQLLRKIESDLGGSRLQVKLQSLKKRLLFVPESREEYAELYRRYCRDAIDFVLDRFQMPDPYQDLITLQQEKPELNPQDGIVVFIVHNLAREVKGTYLFSSDQRDEQVEISLNGKVFTGEIGSYISNLKITGADTIEFEHLQYTIWQNSADSPYNALTVPIEETLHIGFRDYTEKGIRDEIERRNVKTVGDLREIVAVWIAVEEAMVAGFVDSYFPRILRTHFPNTGLAAGDQIFEYRTHADKYRYLKKGIDIVRKLGPAAARDLYKANPGRLKDLLLDDEGV